MKRTRKMPWCYLLGLLAFGGWILLPPRMSTAQPIWSEPWQVSEQLSPTGGLAAAPTFTVDPAGGLHVVWYAVDAATNEAGTSYSDQLLYRARINEQWTSSEPVFHQERPAAGDAFSTIAGSAGLRSPAFELRAAAMAGYDNQLHLVMGNQTTQWFTNAPIDDVVRTMVIFPPWPLGNGAHSQLAGARDGTLHALLSAIPPGLDAVDADICTTCADIFYRRSEDGGITWSRAENLSRLDTHDAEPQIAIDARDRMHVIWERHVERPDPASTNGISYQRSDDHGRTWSQPINMGIPGELVGNGVVVATHTDTVLVVYRGVSSGGVFYQASPDGGATWSEPTLIPSVLSRGTRFTEYPQLSLAADGNGHIHLLMVGVPPAGDMLSAQLLHLIWDGATWSDPAVLASGAPNPLGPRLAIERGNRLHAVWFTSNPDPESGNEQQAVWYSTAQIAAPELAPAPTLTPQPSPIPTPSPTAIIAPTATPLPPEIRQLDTIDGPPLWELRGLQAVGAGLLATTLIITCIGGLWLRSRSE